MKEAEGVTKNKRRQEDPVQVGSIMEVKSLMLSWDEVGILGFMFFLCCGFYCCKLPEVTCA